MPIVILIINADAFMVANRNRKSNFNKYYFPEIAQGIAPFLKGTAWHYPGLFSPKNSAKINPYVCYEIRKNLQFPGKQILYSGNMEVRSIFYLLDITVML
jgi:hypothetical protein